MAAILSTSSSDPSSHGPHPHAPLGRPWALVIALGIVAVFEIYLHTRDPMKLIAYASDEGQYHAVRDTVAAQGPAEVALVGSSQMREGVVMPVLLAELEKKVGRPVRVANYATRGARLDAMDAVVRFLQKQPTPPRLIVVGLGPRDLRADTVDWPRVALFWDTADWWRAFRRRGADVAGVGDALPVVIRNAAGRVLDSLRYREEIALTLKRPFARFGVSVAEDGNPILGEVSEQHLGSRGARSLTKAKVSVRKIFDRARESYMFDQPAKPRPAMRSALNDLVAVLGSRPGGGLLVQMPVADFLQAEIDNKGQTKAFQAAVSEVAKAAGVDFVPVSRQGFRPTDDHFSDLQHLNRSGAEGFATWLATETAKRIDPPSRPSLTP